MSRTNSHMASYIQEVLTGKKSVTTYRIFHSSKVAAVVLKGDDDMPIELLSMGAAFAVARSFSKLFPELKDWEIVDSHGHRTNFPKTPA